MVCQQRSRLIIMVTRLKEGTRVKCHKYWPEKGENNCYLKNESGNGVSVKAVEVKQFQSW